MKWAKTHNKCVHDSMSLANVTTNPCLMWPHYISYAYCSLDKGVAYTGGGGGVCQAWATWLQITSKQTAVGGCVEQNVVMGRDHRHGGFSAADPRPCEPNEVPIGRPTEA